MTHLFCIKRNWNVFFVPLMLRSFGLASHSCEVIFIAWWNKMHVIHCAVIWFPLFLRCVFIFEVIATWGVKTKASQITDMFTPSYNVADHKVSTLACITKCLLYILHQSDFFCPDTDSNTGALGFSWYRVPIQYQCLYHRVDEYSIVIGCRVSFTSR